MRFRYDIALESSKVKSLKPDHQRRFTQSKAVFIPKTPLEHQRHQPLHLKQTHIVHTHMLFSKYYDNPFADDDNDLCYSEILSDQGEPVTCSNHNNNNSNNAGYSGSDGQEKCPSTFSAGSPVSLSRRNEAEALSTETAPSAVRSGDGWKPNAAQRGHIDTSDYEDYIAELRAELESANAENNRLTAAQTKANTRARSLLFDKENVEWQLQQEKERSRALAKRVAALEEELEQMASRAGDFASATRESTDVAPVHRRHVDPQDSSLRELAQQQQSQQAVQNSGEDHYATQDLVLTPLPERQSSTSARAQFQQRQAAFLELHGAPFERGSVAVTPVAAAAPATDVENVEPLSASSNSDFTRTLRSQRRAEAVQEKILQQQKLADKNAAEIKELEDLLQIHCQKRDDLATQLQRLESMRLRTVAERRKKAAVEVSLEEEEKTIGHLRLELRSHSALLR